MKYDISVLFLVSNGNNMCGRSGSGDFADGDRYPGRSGGKAQSSEQH